MLNPTLRSAAQMPMPNPTHRDAAQMPMRRGAGNVWMERPIHAWPGQNVGGGRLLDLKVPLTIYRYSRGGTAAGPNQ